MHAPTGSHILILGEMPFPEDGRHRAAAEVVGIAANLDPPAPGAVVHSALPGSCILADEVAIHVDVCAASACKRTSAHEVHISRAAWP
jgi:hypothetical protein